MPTKEQLNLNVQQWIRSASSDGPGETNARDLREILTDIINELYNRSTSDGDITDDLARISSGAYTVYGGGGPKVYATIQAAVDNESPLPQSSKGIYVNKDGNLGSLINPVVRIVRGTFAQQEPFISLTDGATLAIRQITLENVMVGHPYTGSGKFVALPGYVIKGSLSNAKLHGLDFGTTAGGVINASQSVISKVTGVGTIILYPGSSYLGTPPAGVKVISLTTNGSQRFTGTAQNPMLTYYYQVYYDGNGLWRRLKEDGGVGSLASELGPEGPEWERLVGGGNGEFGSLLQSTGQSTTAVMSQKAVTDALGVLTTSPAYLLRADRTRSYFTTSALAWDAARAGDTIVLSAPVETDVTGGNDAQLDLNPGVSLQTQGFDIGGPLTTDGITFRGGTGKVIGNNSRVYSSNHPSWVIGAYDHAIPGMLYRVYDLHFISGIAQHTAYFNSNCEIHFYNCRFEVSTGIGAWARFNKVHLYFHNCVFHLTGDAIATRSTTNEVKMVFEQCLISTQDRTFTDHLLGDATLGEVHLLSTTVLAENAYANAIKANLVLLDGNTVIKGTILANQIIDQRPERTSSTPLNILPQASAGTDNTITLPNNSVSLTGSGTDSDGSVVGYQWTKVTGPNDPLFNNATIAAPTVSGLIAGSYAFRLTVTDNQGGTASDDVVVVVNPAVANAELLIDPSFEYAVGAPRWQVDQDWTINLGNAVSAEFSTGKIWQDVQLRAGVTYEIEIEASSIMHGGIFFEFTNPLTGSGVGYFRLGAATNSTRYTATADEVRQFAIKGNNGYGVVSRASLKVV